MPDASNANGGSSRYLYTRLGEKKFQELCCALLVLEYPGVTCSPVGHQDGGRDAVRLVDGRRIIYQVKWTSNPGRPPVAWLSEAVEKEERNIARLVSDGAYAYYIMTNVAGTAARDRGTIDRLGKILDEYSKSFGIPMSCWWEADIDARVDVAPVQLKQNYRDMLAGDDRIRQIFGSGADTAPALEPFAELKDRYLERVRQRYGRIDLEVLTPRTEQGEQPVILLGEVFVPQAARLNPPPVELPPELLRRLVRTGEIRDSDIPEEVADKRLLEQAQAYQERPPRPVLDIIAGAEGQRLVFLGDPGSGKSTLARYLMLALASDLRSGPLAPLAGHVPLLVELRTYAGRRPRPGTFLDLINDQYDLEDLGFPKPALEAFLKQCGQALVIFDGLDEIFDPALREQVARQIEGFASRYPWTPIIVTSRPAGYPARSILEAGGFTRYQLQDLGSEQIKAFVTAWYTASLPGDPAEAARLRDRVLGTITSSAAVAELAGNPMLLTILAIIGRRQELPRERRGVYEHAVAVLAEHWDAGKHLHDEKVAKWVPHLSHEDKLELLGRIARRMQEGGDGLAGNRLPRRELEAEFTGYLREGLELPMGQAAAAADAMIRQLRERNFIIAGYGAGLYGFVHRAFLEYLAAEDIHSRFADHVLAENELLAVFQYRWHDPAWEEVLVLLASMLPGKFTAQAIDWLLTADPLWFLHDEGVPRHVLLALRCLGEVRKPGTVTAQSLAVAGALIGLLEIPQHHLNSAAQSALEKTAVPVLARLGPRWAGQRLFENWYQARGRHHDVSWPGSVPAVGRMHLALVGRDHPESADPATAARRRRELTGRLITRRRPGAGLAEQLRYVATRWRDDPETRTWLLGCAVARDAHGRAQALRVLAEEWSSPDFVLLLCGLAVSDPAPEARKAAIKALTVVPDGLTGRLTWLQARAADDEHHDVREAAVSAVAGASPGPDVTEWLCERAVADQHRYVRAAAVNALARRSRDDPRIAGWLRDRAAAAPDDLVRGRALQALADDYADRDLSEWLRDPAVSDQAEVIRRMSPRALAEACRRSPDIARWLRGRVLAGTDWKVRDEDLQLVARHQPDDEIEALLRERAVTDQNESSRRHAMEALAEGWWQAPGMAWWFRQRATADTAPLCQHAAQRVLAACWPDDENARLLRDCARTHPDNVTRAGAAQLLATGWPDDQSWAVLRDRAVSDEDSYVRTTALELLAAAGHDAPGTLTWLLQRASQDPDEHIRRIALGTVAAGWPDQPDTATMLRERAILDEDPFVRAQALRTLAARWPEDDVAALIQERAAADEDHSVRGAATGTLIDTWHDDPAIVARAFSRAEADEDPRVRASAITALALCRPGDRNLASWLKERAHGDEHWHVRAAAVIALWHEGDIAFVRDRAVTDQHAEVRIEAINALGNLPRDPATASLIRERAATDPNRGARMEALVALARQADEHDRAFIRQRASLDPDPVARLRATLARAVDDHPDEFLLGFDSDLELRFAGSSIDYDRLDRDARAMLRERALTDPDEESVPPLCGFSATRCGTTPGSAAGPTTTPRPCFATARPATTIPTSGQRQQRHSPGTMTPTGTTRTATTRTPSPARCLAWPRRPPPTPAEGEPAGRHLAARTWPALRVQATPARKFCSICSRESANLRASPGGTPEKEDGGDLVATLVREAFEENQVRVGATAYLGYQEVHRPGRARYAQVRMAGVIEEFAPRAPDPDGGRVYRRLMTSLEAAPDVLGWGEPAVAQARAASRVAWREWGLPVDAPAPSGYAD